MSGDIAVVLVGASPWTPEPEGSGDLVVARALAERLGGPYDVVVPAGTGSPGRSEHGLVRLHRVAGGRLLFVIRARRLVRRLAVSRPGPGVLLSSDPLGGLLAAEARRGLAWRLVVQVQGEVLTPEHVHGPRPRRALVVAAARHAVRCADAVRAVSPELAAQAGRLTAAPIAMIGSRVDTERFRPSVPCPATAAPPARVVAVGSLVPVKNHRVLIEAWPAVLRRAPAAELVLVGDGPLRAQLEARARELHVAHAVRFLGRVGHSEVRDVLATAVLLAHPSTSEGQPRAVLEGMASGLPVLCSDIAGHRSVVAEGTGLLLPPDSTDAWTRAVLALMEDLPGRQRMGATARRHVERWFSFDANLDAFAALLTATATGSGRAR